MADSLPCAARGRLACPPRRPGAYLRSAVPTGCPRCGYKAAQSATRAQALHFGGRRAWGGR